MAARFLVSSSPRFDRQAAELHKRQGKRFTAAFRAVIEMLETDPSNTKGQYTKRIRKLSGIPLGQGQYRARQGRYRFRYDLFDREVRLVFCGLRREDTYK